MAKISLLPALNDPDGTELVPVVKAGKTMRANVAGLVAGAVAGTVNNLKVDAVAYIGRPGDAVLVDGTPTGIGAIYWHDTVDDAGTVTAIDVFDRAAGTINFAVYRGPLGALVRVALTSFTTSGTRSRRRVALAEPIAVRAGDILALQPTAGALGVAEVQSGDVGYTYSSPYLPETVALDAPTTNGQVQVRFVIAYRKQVVTADTFLASTAVKIVGPRAVVLSSDVNPRGYVEWKTTGLPTAHTVKWGNYTVTLDGQAQRMEFPNFSLAQPFAFVGNSLTDSTDTSNRYSQVLAARYAQPFISSARYSSDWRMVYRTGAKPIILTLAGALPAAGTVAVTQINGAAIDGNNPAAFLTTGDASVVSGMSMSGYLKRNGVTRRATVSAPNGASFAYVVTQAPGQTAITFDGPVTFVPDFALSVHGRTCVIWMGNNFFYSQVPNAYGDYTNPQMWVDLKLIVAFLQAQGCRVILLPIIPAANTAAGDNWLARGAGTPYTAMESANARTEAMFPGLMAKHADGRTLLQFLQSRNDGSPEALDDVSKGFTPRNLRRKPDGSYDLLHMWGDGTGDLAVGDFTDSALKSQSLPAAITQTSDLIVTAFGAADQVPDTVVVRVGRDAVADLSDQMDANTATVSAIPSKGNMPTGFVFGGAGGAGGGTIQPTTDSVFASYGIIGEVVFSAGGATANHQVDFPRRLRVGEWLVASVQVRTTDATKWPLVGSNLRVLAFDAAAATAGTFNFASYEQIDATHRRYYIRIQNTSAVDWARVWLCVAPGVAGQTNAFSGFAVGLSVTKPGAVDWAIWDAGDQTSQNTRIAANDARIAATENALPTLLTTIKSFAFGGSLTPGTGATWILGSAPPVATIADSYLNSAKVAITHAATVNGSTRYLQATAPRPYKPGDWMACSCFVEQAAGDFSWVGATTVRVWIVGLAGGAAQTSVNITTFEQVSANVRRYSGVIQVPAIVGAVSHAFFGVTGSASVTTRFTGFTLGMSENKPLGVDWCDFDPAKMIAHDVQILALQVDVAALKGLAAPVVPDLLLPDTFNLVQGRPLDVYRHAFMASRELTQYEVAFVGQKGTRSLIEFANPQARLDGNRLEGAGAIRIKKRGVDEYNIYNVPVTWYSSPAAKTGSPKILHIRDSLGYQNTVNLERLKLVEAGVTPTYVGTFKEANGLLTEARSSWSAANFVNRVRYVNSDGAGIIYPLRTGGGAGAVFTATLSGGTTGSITGVTINNGGAGYDDNPKVAIVVTGGGPQNHRAIIYGAVVGGVFTSVTIESDTTFFTSVPALSVAPNVAEYLALPSTEFGGRWRFNPCLRPPTAAEVAANDPRIINGYIYDFGDYLRKCGIASPDLIEIGLMTNDATTQTGPVAAANVVEALTLMIASIRAWSASVPIGIITNGRTIPADWQRQVAVIKAVLQNFRGQAVTNKVWILAAHAAVDPKFAHGFAVSSVDAASGVQTGAQADFIHTEIFGQWATAEVTFCFVMCRLPDKP